jgi:hypothetical protein
MVGVVASAGIRTQDFPARSLVTVPTTLSRLLENRMQWGMLGPKADEETGGWRMVRGEEFHDLYCWSDINRVILSRAMGYVLKGTFCHIPLVIFASECCRQIFVYILKVFRPCYVTSLSYPPQFHPCYYILRRLPVVQLSNLLLFPLRSKDFPRHSAV